MKLTYYSHVTTTLWDYSERLSSPEIVQNQISYLLCKVKASMAGNGRVHRQYKSQIRRNKKKSIELLRTFKLGSATNELK